MLDHRLRRALLSLDGLSTGDAFGDQFFHASAERPIEERLVPRSPWFYTDDTEMALAIVDVLAEQAQIDQDLLALEFGTRYERNPRRGYGGTAHAILRAIANGRSWRSAAAAAFEGMGSMGNGAAMRVGPLGAYFAGDPQRVIEEAQKSAAVTHAHPEGLAGAIATALAAAWAAEHPAQTDAAGGQDMLTFVVDHTPGSQVREGIARAAGFQPHCSVMMAASVLGNGSRVTAPDTVPFCLWCASHFLNDYTEAMWTTVSALGDRDTTCAIVGSIVALSATKGIPPHWLKAREELAFRSAKLRA